MKNWNVYGSPADYLSNANPFIIGWWRCGDHNDLSNNTTSGMLRDSGPRHLHLTYLPPQEFYLQLVRPVSGIAPYSISGMQCHNDFTFWPQTGTNNNGGFVNHREARSNDFSPDVDAGHEGIGGENPSGLTLMAWVKIASNGGTNNTSERVIFGKYDFTNVSENDFALTWLPSTNVLSFRYKTNDNTNTPGGTSIVVDNSTDPFKPNVGEEFFIAGQFSREIPESNNNYNFGGSGILRLYTGTTVSGLRLIATAPVLGPDISAGQPIVAGGRSITMMNGSVTSQTQITVPDSMPTLSIVDEIAMIADGNLPHSHIEHYMNSGINYTASYDPISSNFTPEVVLDTDLVAYWTFDNSDGANSSRIGSKLDLYTNGATFVNGIRGGMAIQPGNSKSPLITNTLAASDKTSFVHLTAGSGLNYLFPDHASTRAQTWIGWMKTGVVTTAQYGGAVGWFIDPASTQNQGLISYLAMDHTTTSSSRAQNYSVGGLIASGVLGYAQTSMVQPGVGTNKAPVPGEWHLYAIVFDIDEGHIYIVKDAKDIIYQTQRFSPSSGISKAMITGADSVGGAPPTDDGAIWILANAYPSISNSEAAFDDWAVFNTALSLPQMSGFALSGVTVAASPLSTDKKRTMAFWLGDDVANGSEPRLLDYSWYEHHLTNVSGSISLTTGLNTNISSSAFSIGVSGTIINCNRNDHGSNLDFSNSAVFLSSGMCAGGWIKIPSSMDTSTENHIVGAWSQDVDRRSWRLGIENGKAIFSFKNNFGFVTSITGNTILPKNEALFLHAQAFVSGSNVRAQIYQKTDPLVDGLPTLIADNPSITSFTSFNACDTSGISIGNVQSMNLGFAAGTVMQGIYVAAAHFIDSDISKLAYLGIQNNTLGTTIVSDTDPANISHWKFDTTSAQVEDFGLEQNTLYPINLDGHPAAVFPAIHSNGVVIRQSEYLDTLSSNSQSRRLDLGSGNQSWTLLGWITPPSPTASDERVIMNKGSGPDNAISGIKIYTPSDSLKLYANASGKITIGENGNLAPEEWSHIAVVFDRDNNEFTTIINGRYAGATFETLVEVPTNNSGLVLGGRGDQNLEPIAGGSAFSGLLDDVMIFSRALTLPEISGLALNSYSYNDGSTQSSGLFGAWVSGVAQNIVSGVIASYVYGLGIQSGLYGGYLSGVFGETGHVGGYVFGQVNISGLFGAYIQASSTVSGLFGYYLQGLGINSGIIGSYTFGAGSSLSEFDISLLFEIVDSKDFDAYLTISNFRFYDFDALLDIFRITSPPSCTLELPLVGLVASGIPYTLTARGSGIATENKEVSKVRFTFADFKKAAVGTLVDGFAFSGLYESTRVFDTPGWYTIKIEVIDSFGYRTSCARPFLLLDNGAESGTYLASLPEIQISGTPVDGVTIQRVNFTHSINGLTTTSGLLEYTDFADGQESVVNSLEMPSGITRVHDYTMPGLYSPVWALSGQFGIISDSISEGIDYTP